MNHPSDDQLLLFSYGELPAPEAAAAEAHLVACPTCRAQLERLERSRVALDVALPARRRRLTPWLGALAAAAAVVAVFFANVDPPPSSDRTWRPPAVSATAGYIAGGTAVVEIDAQLTRLEQERYYALPN
jgi:anti-sigma factor RsiW